MAEVLERLMDASPLRSASIPFACSMVTRCRRVRSCGTDLGVGAASAAADAIGAMSAIAGVGHVTVRRRRVFFQKRFRAPSRRSYRLMGRPDPP